MMGTYADWRGHVIVCGLHSVGLRIVEELNLSGVPAVVIDDHPDPALARQLADWGVPHVPASSRSAATLAGAGLASATAVICALDDDLVTLETALLTRELRADVRVVVQLGNPAVGRALAQINVSVLDVAGLSAPSIAEACLRSGIQEIPLDGERFLAARTTAPRRATLRELYGALAPVAVLPADGEDAAICPGRDHVVAAGNRVTLFATPEELRTAGISAQVRYPAHARPFSPVRRARHMAVSVLRAVADRRMATALAALVVVLIASTTILHLTYRAPGPGRLSVLNAAYFTVETVTTVGYGDFFFRGQSPALVAGAICLMLLGAMFVAVFFAMLTNMIVSRRLEESLGRQRITGLSGHVIVIGLGTVGTRVIQRLVAAAGTWWRWTRTRATVGWARSARWACRSSSPTRRCRRRWKPPACRTPPRWPWSPATTWLTWRPGWPSAISSASGGRACRSCSACSTRRSPGPSGTISASPRCAPPPRWPRPGSSARRSAWTCSARSTPTTSRCSLRG